MNMPLLAAYMLSILTLLLTPGPVIALITDAAARDGYGSAVRTMIGTNLASLTLIASATLMLTGIVAINPRWLAGLGMAGALYIGSIALRSLLPGCTPQALAEKQPASHSGLIAGYLTGVANPKDILFFVAFFPQIIAVTPDIGSSLTLLTLVWLLLDLTVLSLYIFAVTCWLSGGRMATIETFSGLFLLAVALFSFAYNPCDILFHTVTNETLFRSKTFRMEHYTTFFFNPLFPGRFRTAYFNRICLKSMKCVSTHKFD